MQSGPQPGRLARFVGVGLHHRVAHCLAGFVGFGVQPRMADVSRQQ